MDNDDCDSLDRRVGAALRRPDHRSYKFLGDCYAEYTDLSSNNPNPSLGLSYTEGIDAALCTASDVAYFIKGIEYFTYFSLGIETL